MKTKYTILALLFSLFCLIGQTQAVNITSAQTISVTTDYVDNASMTWYVTNPIGTNQPLRINYNIGTEYLCDYVNIYSINASGGEILLVSLSGIQSGSISSVIPTGKVKITFTTDGSVCYQSNTAFYSGLNISFSPDNTWVASSVANTYTNGNTIVNGNVGIGVLNPSYKLEVNGTAKFLDNVQCKNSISFQNNNRFWVSNTNVPTLSSSNPQYSMLQYGIAAPLTNGSAELWLSGNGGIRMFTAGNPTPAVNVLTNGNVGIGTITPATKLDVAGDITFGNDGAYNFLSGRAAGAAIQFGTNSGTWNRNLNLGFIDNNRVFSSVISLIHQTGYVGIGTISPGYSLDVVGNIKTRLAASANATGIIIGNNGSEQAMIQFNASDNSARFKMQVNGVNTSTERLSFYAGPLGGVASNEALSIAGNGNIKIGTSSTNPSDELLTVFGVIHAKEVKVDLTGFADFVFDKNYKLMPLNQVEQYVNANSHLPEIPSAAEVSKNGMNMGDMQNKLLQKVEELTLYVIEQQKQIAKQSKQINDLQRQVGK